MQSKIVLINNTASVPTIKTSCISALGDVALSAVAKVYAGKWDKELDGVRTAFLRSATPCGHLRPCVPQLFVGSKAQRPPNECLLPFALKQALQDDNDQFFGIFRTLFTEMDSAVMLEGIDLRVEDGEEVVQANVTRWTWEGNPKSDFVVAYNEVVLGTRVTLIGWRKGVEDWRDCCNWMSAEVSTASHNANLAIRH